MKRIIIRGLASGKTPLTPDGLKLLKELPDEGCPRTERAAPHNADKPVPAPPKPVQTARNRCRPGRLVFVSLLPGRWVRCTGAMLGCLFFLVMKATIAAAGIS